MRKTVKIALGTGTMLALALGAAMPANADVQPNAGDAVGMGSDTVQYVSDFLDNGYNATGTALNGYNTIPKIFKIFNFDATADAAGRAQYGATGRTSAGPFPSAVVLRAGGFPYYRAQGSGDGIGDFNRDTVAPYKLNFVRSSRLPSIAEQNLAGTNGFGAAGNGLHVYQIATDGLDIGVNVKAANVTVVGDPVSCAPTDGLTLAELVNIYKGTWQVFGDITNYATRAPVSPGSCATEPIAAAHPDISKSGTGKDFDGDLKAGNGGVAITYSTRSILVEEHDPAAISFPTTVAATIPGTATSYGPQDVIAPFSTGRYNLIQKGYFDHVLDGHGATSTVYKDTIGLQQAGVGAVAAGAYHKNRVLYIIVRDNDVTATGGFLPGGTQNLVQTFFKGTGSWYGKPANAALYTAAGVTQAYSDLGTVNSGS